MREVGDRIREYIALIKLMQPAGRMRLGFLTIEAFILIVVVDIILGTFCLSSVIWAIVISLVYIFGILIFTLERMR